MNIETTIGKNQRDGWQAKSYILVAEGIADDFKRVGTRKLCIETSKSVSGGGVITRASVSLHSADGCYTHAFGLSRDGSGDYSKRVIQSPARGTEKAIREQHAQALTQAEALLAEANAHYAAQDARKAQQQAEQVPA